MATELTRSGYDKIADPKVLTAFIIKERARYLAALNREHETQQALVALQWAGATWEEQQPARAAHEAACQLRRDSEARREACVELIYAAGLENEVPLV